MMDAFLRSFNFRREGAMRVGVEREAFLADTSGRIVPLAPHVLAHLPDRRRFGYELSACQLEERVGPCGLEGVLAELLHNDEELKGVEQRLNFRRSYTEVAPPDMPLDVYPDPTGRYQTIVKALPKAVLLAACRVIGTHVHIGMPDRETALRVYNKVCGSWAYLWQMGDASRGERLILYKKVAPDFEPPRYESWEAFHREACERGFVEDPRRCWHVIRLSVHGTIEFRVFGATEDLNKVVEWASECHALCSKHLS